MTDNDPPLLASWLKFREAVLHQDDDPAMDDFMTTFYGGAGTILTLLRSAHEQGGDLEFQYAFAVLSGELEEFQAQMRRRMAEEQRVMQ